MTFCEVENTRTVLPEKKTHVPGYSTTLVANFCSEKTGVSLQLALASALLQSLPLDPLDVFPGFPLRALDQDVLFIFVNLLVIFGILQSHFSCSSY